jgi:hypothetical protein
LEVVQSIIDEQKAKWTKIMNGEDVKLPPHIVLIFEDVMGDEKVRDVLLDKLAGLARHFYCRIYILVQDPKIITPKVRQNADVAAFTYQTMKRTIDSIYEDYAGILGDKYEFRDMLNENTQDYHLVVVDQTKARYKPEDLFYLDAPKLEVEPFAIGDDSFWKKAKCDWRKQVTKFQSLPPNDSVYWKQQLKKRWKSNKNEEEDEPTEVDDPMYGTEEEREAHLNKLKKRYDTERSHVDEARDTISNLFKYVPTKKR